MMPITKDLLDQLLNEYEKPEDLPRLSGYFTTVDESSG